MATQNCSNKQSAGALNVQLGDSNESQQVLGAVNTLWCAQRARLDIFDTNCSLLSNAHYIAAFLNGNAAMVGEVI